MTEKVYGSDDSTLAGGGELGARMRAIDWSRTELGPVESWPQSLKTCVRIVLTSRQPMFVWWGDRLINLYNDAYKSILGGKHPAALAQPASEVWREIWDQISPRAATAMRANEGTYDEALLLVMERNGYPEETYYTFSYSPVPNDEGAIGGILCANTDDTQRIIGERQLALLRDLAARTADARTVEEACRSSARSLQTDARDVPFALLYLADADGSGASLAATVGVSDDQGCAPARVALEDAASWPIGRVMTSDEMVVVDDLGFCRELPTGAWRRPPSRAVALPLDATGRGGVLVVGLNPFRLLDEGYAGFLRLIAGQIAASMTNAQAYEQERRRAEALAEVDRAKTAFFSNISHEFRTPLTLMLGPTEDALEHDAELLAGESLRAVHRNQLRLLKLVNALLDFSRIEAGRVQASYQPTDLARLTRELASAFDSTIARGGVHFEVDCPPVGDDLYVDRDMWEKIVLNLISNAFKFTFTGTIRVALRRVGDARVELTVEDTGVGIPDGELPRIFERFHRVEGSRSRTHEGSGIGLALVHDLAALHGGDVRVESRLGEGSSFVVGIPAGDAHLPIERVGTRAGHERNPTGAASYVAEAQRWVTSEDDAAAAPSVEITGHVLVVDDNADMREYVARLLRQQGWTVEVAVDGVQALATIRGRRPDLVLTDVMMPKLDGFGLLRALRTEPETASLPIIMLSARAGEESRIEGLGFGANDYLVKPFTARELIARVQAQLAAAEVRKLETENRERLHRLFLQAPVAIALFRGPHHVFDVVNAACVVLLGGRDVVGKSVREALPELEEQGIVALLDRVYSTGEPISIRDLVIKIDRDGDGVLEEAAFSFVYQPVIDSAGRVEGVLSVATDVTPQIEAQRAIQDREERLKVALDREQVARSDAERANRTKDEFLAMLGHELRNPLAPILTALHLMQLRGSPGADKERSVIERQVNYLVRLVDDLLDVSRITRGKVELRRERVEIAQVIAKAIETASPLLEQRQHSLHIDVPRSGLPVDVDPTRMAQVISNLLTNAAKYTEPGGDIAIVAVRDGDQVVVRVRDTGIGIAKEMLPVVFDLFAQEQQSLARSQGGLGLGLAIVRTLVTMHGGEVEVTSEGRGHGSEFTVRLPAIASTELAEPEWSPRRSSASRPRLGRRVLVVDDNTDAAEMLADSLEEIGCTTRVAHDGPTALRLAEDFRPDVALLDIGLPVMDGYELARRLRELPELAGVRLVAVTGYGQDADRRLSTAAGFDQHLVKPISLESIEAAVTDGATR